MHPNMCIFTNHIYLVIYSNMHGHNAAVELLPVFLSPAPGFIIWEVECVGRVKQEAERLRWVGSYVLGTLVS